MPRYYKTKIYGISIHAPTWGATPNRSGFDLSHEFQSTHPRGVRLQVPCGKCCECKFQSTHPRGVRPTTSSNTTTIANFNPRTHVGCDSVRGAMCSSLTNFNPRTHVGCDDQNIPFHTVFSIFQSTHPRGVRLSFNNSPNIFEIFQSTHPRGVRQTRPVIALGSSMISIHAPTWGATIRPERYS